MKKILLISLAFIGINANAQYFEGVYGTSSSESVSDAIVTSSGGDDGYFMVGTTPITGSGTELVVARTDASGEINTACVTCFVKSYKMWASISTYCSSPTSNYQLSKAKCAERKNSSKALFDGRFEVVTEMKVGSNNWLSYTELDQFGNIVYGPVDLILPSYSLQLGAVTTSADETSIYITGTTSAQKLYIIKYDITTHSITWSKLYDITATQPPVFPTVVTSPIEYANDIIEDAANNRVIVVGRVEETVTTLPNPAVLNSYGLIFTANNSSGAAITANVYGNRTTSLTDNSFNSIKTSAQGSGGFIISGHSNIQGNVDFWAMRLSTALAISWTKVLDYSYAGTGVDELGRDIVERHVSGTNYEYYQIGNVVLGDRVSSTPKSQDIVVYKLDVNGNAIGANGQFTYGSIQGESGTVIDLHPSNGFVFFGETLSTSGGGDQDFYAAHSYFNGYTACTGYIATTNTSGTGYSAYKTGAAVSESSLTFYPTSIFGLGTDANSDRYCDGTSGSGDNSRVAPNNVDDNKYDNIKVGPNPTLQGTTTTTTLFIEANQPEQVTVSVYDMLGKQIYSNDFTVKKGDNNLSIDLSANRLVHGMYSIKINGTTTNQSRMLLVE